MSHLGYKILYKILNDDPRTLAERCYAPWVDMEARAPAARDCRSFRSRARGRSRDFDVVGFSLQFELTYTNCLTMLDLGGIPLRAADRGEDDPLVIAGGPTATHPEPIAPFLDAIVVGDGEEKLTEVALLWTELQARRRPARERLARSPQLGGVYVPSLYAVSRDPDTGSRGRRPAAIVDAASLSRCSARSSPTSTKFPFPDDGPVGGPEAIFDRMSIEIARGCTEGCRFCQAGMIYRPVRERDPAEIVDTVRQRREEVGLRRGLAHRRSPPPTTRASRRSSRRSSRSSSRRTSRSASPRCAPTASTKTLLDEIGKVRATGLTFAPEAGTQRMRDVVNKNVTEEQLLETAERVFSRGWSKMKLYFMIGLPTEEDEDVRGIVATGARALGVGRKLQGQPRQGHGQRLDPRAQAAHAVSVVRDGSPDELDRKQQHARGRCARSARRSQDPRRRRERARRRLRARRSPARATCIERA